MRVVISSSVWILGLCLLGSVCMESQTLARQDRMSEFFDKKDATIAVVDSGLGGLSIAAQAAERLSADRYFRSVRIVFFNALFSEQGGYNSLRSRTEKIRIFDSALNSLVRSQVPDLILIGCNTLSVLYPDTDFSRQSPVPVRGIVDSGVETIAQQLRAFQESYVIILGTQTTVEEGLHKDKLIKKGFLPERIIQQSCPDLVPYIELGYNSSETEMLIAAYVDEALQKLPEPGHPVLVSLNCTHYGYSLELWKKAFTEMGSPPLAILNPNARMLDFLFSDQSRNRSRNTEVTVEVISMVQIKEAQQKSIGTWLQTRSPRTAEALRQYLWVPDLFEWKSLIQRDKKAEPSAIID
jgi:glutamate racemase